LSASIDAALHASWDPQRTLAQKTTLVAVGGYGRFEVTPGADVDLWVIGDKALSHEVSDALMPFVRSLEAAHLSPAIKYISQDALHTSLRTDMKTRVACFDVRVVDRSDPKELLGTIEESVLRNQPETLMRFLRTETIERREKLRSHWYLREPNLKMSEGALRDLHSVRWIQRLLAENALEIPEDQKTTLLESHRFLLWLRSLVHLSAKSNKDNLSYERQRELVALAKAHNMDTPALDSSVALMTHYFEHTRHVAWTLRRWLAWGDEWFHSRNAKPLPDRRVPAEEGVVIRGGRLGLAEQGREAPNPICGLRLFRAVAHTGLKLHHTVYNGLRRSLEAHPDPPKGPDIVACFSILADLVCLPDHGTKALEGVHDAGLLSWCLPSITEKKGLDRQDPTMLYTDDIHALRTIDTLKRIAVGKAEGEASIVDLLVHGYANDPTLHIAQLLLPLETSGNGAREELRAEVRSICDKMGRPETFTEEVLFLLEHFRGFVRIALTPDWTDRDLGRGLAREIPSIAQLDRLYLMAYANLAASNQNMVTAWQYAQMKSVYHSVRGRISKGLGLWTDGDSSVEKMVDRVVHFLLGHIPLGEHPEKERVAHHFRRLPTRYARMVGPEDVGLHMDLLEDHERQKHGRISLAVRRLRRSSSEPRARAFQSGWRTQTEVVFAGRDRKNLMLAVCSALAGQGINIRRAYAFRTLDDFVLLVFVVAGNVARPQDRAAVLGSVEASLDDVDAFEQRLRTKAQADSVNSEEGATITVDVDDVESSDFLSLAIQAKDRSGLLFDLLCATEAMRLEIPQICLWTEGENVRGTVLLSELNGRKPKAKKRVKAIVERVQSIFGGTTV
jgi:[protein-PII] uridylyltransferase